MYHSQWTGGHLYYMTLLDAEKLIVRGVLNRITIISYFADMCSAPVLVLPSSKQLMLPERLQH